ncbi:anthranilate synthase [Rhodobium orientis]|uniref:Anthranilate synthase n=1 Tax=Rhodobium orientis TaxID=34017 RepID=A0A327JJP7_9HYPH|nr:anthranilate synthase [Rhodobium orientis]MBB4305091.1 anthranilate synthase [Rhodobium orientis]MBK5952159.1 anthranilate synthase component I [Rhodobium orientis]RAI25624.1 anthranilate synthase component I [Rhodobium orientis]
MSASDKEFTTAGGITVRRSQADIAYGDATRAWIDRLDTMRGAVFSSNYEYPGRYTRWDVGFVNPPLALTTSGRTVAIEALNARGAVLIAPIAEALKDMPEAADFVADERSVRLTIKTPEGRFSEEDRSRQPTVFSVVRRLVALFGNDEDENFGFYGAFGYDLAFQFEPIPMKLERPDDQRDMVLYLPDEVLVVDHYGRRATVLSYDVAYGGTSSAGLARDGAETPFAIDDSDPGRGDHEPGEYADVARTALPYFQRGDLFEVVPGQTFYERCTTPPSAIARRLTEINPAPYAFFINLGAAEYLVGASPEMFVRVTGGRRVETCPISGTIRRGRDAIEDEAQIRKLLNSAKDEAELTMCSDVDRNDKSRVCVPGSVRVIGRRQIEMYSRLIHTVDHIEGLLRDGMDALDAFLSHAWAVTVTGAPKRWAMEFIENQEKSPRSWYGGAIGMVHFNGDLNTGLTLRTIRIKNGIAEIRAGATLLYDSVPEDEERETELKAEAMRAAVREAAKAGTAATAEARKPVGEGVTILLVDHEDSFVHTLANYFRQTGARVVTLRSPVDDAAFEEIKPDLVVLSPGPGSPTDFNCAETIGLARKRELPVFGVCLGLQALAEAFGATLGQLAIPVHGKPSVIKLARQSTLFAGLGETATVGRYHSLHAVRDTLPPEINVTAVTDDGVVMAIEHREAPIAAVQFHPESIMTLEGDTGYRIIENAIGGLVKR